MLPTGRLSELAPYLLAIPHTTLKNEIGGMGTGGTRARGSRTSGYSTSRRTCGRITGHGPN